MQSAFATHVGQRQHNQDNGLSDRRAGLYAVADGVGGGDSGEIASASVCMQLHQRVIRGDSLGEAIRGCHFQLVNDHQGGERGYAASTVVAIQEDGPRLQLAWVGDSRIYRLRDGRLELLTEDHSLVQQRSADLSPEDSRRMRHVLTQAVGAAGEAGLMVDVIEADRSPGDRWLLCSDGLHGVLDDNALMRLLSESGPLQEVADNLIRQALAAGTDDNVTVVVLEDDQPASHPDSGIPLSGEGVAGAAENSTLSSVDEASQRPWHYMVLGGVLAVLLFAVLIWGL